VKYFFNFTNHPSSKWGDEQIAAAKEFGEIIDVQFPNIKPEISDEGVKAIIHNILGGALFYYDEEGESTVQRRNITLHVMGEMCGFFQSVIFAFQSQCFSKVVVSTTERKVIEKDGIKTSEFKFIQFREIQNPLPKIIEDEFKKARASGSAGMLWDQ